ncbi:MAG: hypothetical protein NTV34_10525 [Proteobacteria bacterium]|nr:hypothetical protein [Pseudomonadota bacterium]
MIKTMPLLVNGSTGDPAVLIYLPQHREAVLFDAGDLSALPLKELLRIKTVCISHTHIDHFIGFDRLIRANIPHFRSLDVIGPQGIVENVRGKLNSYTWNLLGPNQVTFNVYEIDESGSFKTALISNSNGFVPVYSPVNSPNNSLISSIAVSPLNPFSPVAFPIDCPAYEVRSIILDHGTPVCCFSVKLPDRFKVSLEKIVELGLEPGPWISALQGEALSGILSNQTEVAPGIWRSTETLLEKVLTKLVGEKTSYVTDIVFSSENLSRLVPFLDGSDTLICEANFRDEHRDRALEKRHLTTKQAALLAAASKTKMLKIFHISAIYGEDSKESEVECEGFLDTFRGMDSISLQRLIHEEFKGH